MMNHLVIAAILAILGIILVFKRYITQSQSTDEKQKTSNQSTDEQKKTSEINPQKKTSEINPPAKQKINPTAELHYFWVGLMKKHDDILITHKGGLQPFALTHKDFQNPNLKVISNFILENFEIPSSEYSEWTLVHRFIDDNNQKNMVTVTNDNIKETLENICKNTTSGSPKYQNSLRMIRNWS